MSFMNDFHFLRPLWLIALPIMWILVFWLARRRKVDGDWSRFIDPALLSALRLDAGQVAGMRPWPWLALLWTLAVLALAGPTWERVQTTAYQAPASWLFVLDVSPSMLATDVSPNRITRARYALDDLLGAAQDARVGLIAFSDGAYTVTPLTQDVATVRALLQPLHPDIMPSPGDDLAPALEKAAKLLAATGGHDRHVVLLTDGYDDSASALSAAAALKARGLTLSVVGVGTPGGAPLPSKDGRFIKDVQGQLQMVRLDVDQLQQLARSGGGRYVDIAGLPRLIQYLQAVPGATDGATAAQGVEVSHWRDEGFWLLPVLLLLAASLARRGWL